ATPVRLGEVFPEAHERGREVGDKLYELELFRGVRRLRNEVTRLIREVFLELCASLLRLRRAGREKLDPRAFVVEGASSGHRRSLHERIDAGKRRGHRSSLAIGEDMGFGAYPRRPLDKA